MLEHIAEELGRFKAGFMRSSPRCWIRFQILVEKTILRIIIYIINHGMRYMIIYVRKNVKYGHLCDMLIGLDEHSDEIWENIEQLPVVLCHRDFGWQIYFIQTEESG